MSALFSTAYMPPIQYVAAMMQHGGVQIETKETYPKQTYRNRALIMTAGGVRGLVVPVVRTRGNHTRTEEITIDYRTRWNIVHLRTLEAAYAASPFYFYYKEGMEEVLSRRHERLLDLNGALLEWLFKCLKISTVVEYTDDWLPTGPGGRAAHSLDYRDAFSPKKPLPAQMAAFENKPYFQVFSDRHPFAGGLSTVDLLFNLGPEAAAYLSTVPSV